jgi:DDE superfamily endonuclease/Archaeal putative transposase ISC1217
MLTIPEFAQPVLSSFAPVFYHPTYQRFLVLLLAALLTTGRRTVSNLLRTTSGLARGDASSFHRVLSQRRWSTLALARILTGFILDHWVPDGPVLVAGDDTVDEHRGAKVYGKGCHRDPVRSTHSYTAFRWGHKWVVLAILVPFPFAARPWALPVLVALYHSPPKVAKSKAPAAKRRRRKAKDKTKVQARQRAGRKAVARAQAETSKTTKASSRRRHKTPSELMRQLLMILAHWFPERQFVFAGDGGYGTHALARFAARRRRRSLTLVSLFYANAALHDPPPVVVGKKPSHRPRKKGAKRPTPAAVVAATERRQQLEVSWYGGGRRTVEVVSGTGYWHKSGEGLVEVLWVYVHDLTGTHRDSYLFSTDPTMPPAQVIATYTARWNIETTFQEMRAYLGLETTRGRTKNTVLRAAPCLFGLYSVVALLYATSSSSAPTEATVRYPGKTAVTFSDAISVVRRQLWLEGVFESHGQTEAFRNLPEPLQAVLLAALAPAA